MKYLLKLYYNYRKLSGREQVGFDYLRSAFFIFLNVIDIYGLPRPMVTAEPKVNDPLFRCLFQPVQPVDIIVIQTFTSVQFYGNLKILPKYLFRGKFFPLHMNYCKFNLLKKSSRSFRRRCGKIRKRFVVIYTHILFIHRSQKQNWFRIRFTTMTTLL